MAVTATPPPVAAPRRSRLRYGDVALAACVAGLLAFPVLARVAANRLPIAPADGLPALAPGPRAAPLQALPAGLRPGPAPERVADLRPAAVALLGPQAAHRLLAVVSTNTYPERTGGGDVPYRYEELERILPPAFTPGQVASATDLGARLTLLKGSQYAPGPAAYALLDRARRGGACAPALDVLLLVSAAQPPDAAAVEAEARRAAAACPGDPTPLWLAGETQSELALPSAAGEDARRLAAPALTTFRRLERALPRSPAGWSGEADAYVRIAAAEPARRAFVIRDLYRSALVRYRRALALQPGPQLEAGVVRALAGLNRASAAAALQERVAAALPGTAMDRRALAALEGAHRFGAEAVTAARLLDGPQRPPPGPGVFPDVPEPEQPLSDDVLGPLSLGAGRLTLLAVLLVQATAGGQTSNADVADTSFIPVFRPMPGLTSPGLDCLGLAAGRARLLAGSPAAALTGLSDVFRRCPDGLDAAPLKAVAQLTLGDRPGAEATARSSSGPGGGGAAAGSGRPSPDEARQNLLRWAGDLAGAEAAARDWTAAAPRDVLALIRLGEVEYLRNRFNDAARTLAAAARLARDEQGTWSVREAEAQLERGGALNAAARWPEAQEAFRTADDVASRALALDRSKGVGAARLAIVSGYARQQLADGERLHGALREAADDYAAARERPRTAPSRGALENNAAIVDVALGDGADALTASRRARKVDPENPAYLMTGASAADRGGHAALARRLESATLAADPSTAPAANDLGVLLARRGDDQRAVAALRRAVGAEPDYALAWFNLGVVLSRMGPLHLPASQGALARAFGLDPRLRDRERVPTADNRTYHTGLDVSRKLPPEWSFASSQHHSAAKTAGLAALLLAVFGLSRALTATGSGRGLAESWLDTVERFGGSRLRRFRHPAIAVAATVAVFAWPLARDPGGGVTAALAGLAALALLVAIALRARRGGAQTTWAPGVLFAAGAAAVGLTWAPLPVLGAKAGARRHWAGPVALAAVALPLVALTAWSGVPLARTTAAAALIMASSLLTPVKPVDGGALAAAGGTSAGLAGLALAILLVLGLV